MPTLTYSQTPALQTASIAYRAVENTFAAWAMDGLRLSSDGALIIDFPTAHAETDPYPPGGYSGGNFYNGDRYQVGSAASPVIEISFEFIEAIPSWNAVTPQGTWIEILLRARRDKRWGKWRNLGVWASDDSTIRRHSVKQKGVATDTLRTRGRRYSATALQMQVRLFSARPGVTPVFRNIFAACSTALPKDPPQQPGDPALWGAALPVPACSQMVYPNGGNVWCSPTCISMLLGYYGHTPGVCEPRVRAAVQGVYDWIYRGHGNWSFNVAYAAAFGLESCIRRYACLAQLESWIANGIPLVVSIGWSRGDLTGAPIPVSRGHLVVLTGFDSAGNPLVNDPAASSDEAVPRTYLRAEFEKLWLERSGGTVYLIHP